MGVEREDRGCREENGRREKRKKRKERKGGRRTEERRRTGEERCRSKVEPLDVSVYTWQLVMQSLRRVGKKRIRILHVFETLFGGLTTELD